MNMINLSILKGNNGYYIRILEILSSPGNHPTVNAVVC